MKEVRCIVCKKRLKRRKYRKAGVGPACMRKLRNGSTGIQIEAFRDFDIEGWNQRIKGESDGNNQSSPKEDSTQSLPA